MQQLGEHLNWMTRNYGPVKNRDKVRLIGWINHKQSNDMLNKPLTPQK